MSLAEALRNALHLHHLHATAQTNQGTVHLIEGHIKRLDNVLGDAAQHEAEAQKILSELYAALNAPAPAAAIDVAKAVEDTVKDVEAARGDHSTWARSGQVPGDERQQLLDETADASALAVAPEAAADSTPQPAPASAEHEQHPEA